MNDLVLDKKNNFIYITDSDIHVARDKLLNGALIIVDISTDEYKVRRVLSGSHFT